MLVNRQDLNFFTAWSDEDQVYLHFGVGHIDGFVWRYAVESHNPEISNMDVDMIVEAFNQQAVMYVSGGTELQ